MSSNTEKRSVSTDALETLGTLIDDRAGRDAIHLAVEPAIAATKLRPGQDVGFVDGEAGPSLNNVGIVDPFLKSDVLPGQRFWLVVYPRQITSLRHVWSHPEFPEAEVVGKPDRTESERWLRQYFNSIGVDYDGGIEEATEAQTKHYVNFGTGDNGDIPDEFWDHFETVTDVKATHRPDWFSCAC